VTDSGHDYCNADGVRAGNWMQTYTGRQFWPLDPRAGEVHVIDIAHALANACRFGGHCEQFYSVAEHSVLVSLVVPQRLALAALLHDASEAYVVDIPRPIKPYLAGYKEIEAQVQAAVHERFGIGPLDNSDQQAIKDADNAVLLAEADQIMKDHPAPWSVPGEPAKVRVTCWVPDRAKELFLARWAEINSGVPSGACFDALVHA